MVAALFAVPYLQSPPDASEFPEPRCVRETLNPSSSFSNSLSQLCGEEYRAGDLTDSLPIGPETRCFALAMFISFPELMPGAKASEINTDKSNPAQRMLSHTVPCILDK